MTPRPQLPLPIARLRRRSFNAREAKVRHDTAYQALEASIRLAVAVTPPRDVSKLARGTVGGWAHAMSVATRDKLTDPRVLELYALLTELGLGAPKARESLRAERLIEVLPAYRNRHAHGATRDRAFYERAGPVLLAGLDAAWSAGVFLPRDGQLLYAESVTVEPDEGRRARLVELAGDATLLVDPAGSPVPEQIRPRRVYWRHGDTIRELHPWLVYEETRERLYCFNGLGRNAEFLDYGSGDTLHGADLERACPGAEADVRALFAGQGTATPADPVPAPAPADPDADPPIPERFEVREQLYRGDQNVRLRAYDRDLEQEVVLEFSGPGVRRLRSSATERRDVLRQARMRAKVAHPLVQQQKDFVETASCVILVLAPCPGKTLEDDMRNRDRLLPEQVVSLGIDLASAAHSLHAKGVVHRAIAAPNILVSGPGRLSALTGFAFAKNMVGFGSSLRYRRDDAAPTRHALPAHPAPEQVSGQPASARSDVFALGCVLYECLTGTPAFADHTAEWVEPKSPHKLAPGVPRQLATILMKCLERGPTSRFNTMLELGEALGGVHDERGTRGALSAVAWIAIAVAVVGLAAAFYFGFLASA